MPARRNGDSVFTDRHLTVSRTLKPRGLMLAGEIDISNSGALADTLRTRLDGAHTAHLDLSRVVFCDVSGIRALVRVARELGPDRKLLLHGLPAQLETVIRVTGWADMPGLDICACDGGV